MAMESTTAPPRPAPPARRRHDLPVGIGISILAAIIGLIVLAWAILFITKGRFLKPTFEKYAGRMAGRDIRVGGDFQFYFAPFDLKFLAERMTVSNPKWASRPHFFTARLIDTRVKTFSWLFGRGIRAEYLTLDGAAVDAEWDRQRRNTWTFGDPDKKGEPFDWPVIQRAAITGTTVRYVDPALLLTTNVAVDTIRSTGSSSPRPARSDSPS